MLIRASHADIQVLLFSVNGMFKRNGSFIFFTNGTIHDGSQGLKFIFRMCRPIYAILGKSVNPRLPNAKAHLGFSACEASS